MSMTLAAALERCPWGGVDPRAWQAECFERLRDELTEGSNLLVRACTGSGKSRLIGRLTAYALEQSEAIGIGDGILITTPTQQLVDQLAYVIGQHIGPDRVGRFFQHSRDAFRDVVVVCHASLSRLIGERPEWHAWLVDEAHKLEGDNLRELAEEIGGGIEWSVGFTATPYRGDRRGLARWDRVVYEYTSHDAVRDGVLVPFRAVRSDEMRPVDDLVAEWLEESEGPGVISARTIDEAEAVADRFDRVAPIHSGMRRGERDELIAQLHRGELRALVHVSLLAEGIDLPWLRWIMLRRPTQSPTRLVQEVGRVLRVHPGKTEATIYDPHDLLAEIGLTHPAQLDDLQSQGAQPPRDSNDAGPMGLGEMWSARVTDAQGWLGDAIRELRGGRVLPAAWPGDWRYGAVSEPQLRMIRRCWRPARARLPQGVPELLAELPRPLSKGTASDLIALLKAAIQHPARVLPLLPPIVLPEPEPEFDFESGNALQQSGTQP